MESCTEKIGGKSKENQNTHKGSKQNREKE